MVYKGKVCNSLVSGLATNFAGSPEGFALGAVGQAACAVGMEMTGCREEPWKSPDRSTFRSLQESTSSCITPL